MRLAAAFALLLPVAPATAAGFVDDMLGRMPPGMAMPREVVAVLKRMEAGAAVIAPPYPDMIRGRDDPLLYWLDSPP